MMASGGEVIGGEGGLALIQKALGDERARSDQHKQNYEHIKGQLAQLQERYSILEKQYQQALEDGQAMQTKAKTTLQQLQKDLRDRNADVEELKLQVLTPEKEELLRQKIALEQEQPFAEKLYAVELESEKFRNDYNGLRYQLAVVQSEFESEQKKAERTIEELQLKFGAERDRLQRERDDALAQCLKATETEGENKRHLSRENFKLQNRVKSFMEEVAEEKAKREEIASKLESTNKRLVQQIADLKTKVRGVESEKSSLSQQLKISSDKAESLTASNASLHGQILETEKQKESIVVVKEKQERDFKRELNALQIDAVKLKSDHAKEKDELKNRVVVLECEVEMQKERVAKKVEEVLEKEREGEKRVAEMREEEWKEKQKREEEKATLENKVAEVEKRAKEEKEKAEAEKEKSEEEKLKSWEEKRDLEREVVICKKDVKEKEKKEEELATMTKKVESLREDNNSLRKENGELKLILERTEMENEKLSSKVDIYSRELEVVSANLAEFKGSTERYATQMKRGHESALKAAHEKYEKALKINHDIKKTADSNAGVYQRQKAKYLKVIRHFKRSNALVKAEMEELKALNENMNNNVPAETHFALKKKLKEMMRRHAEFQSLLLYAAPDAAGASSIGSPAGVAFAAEAAFPCSRLIDDGERSHRRNFDHPAAASSPEPILRNSSQNRILPERKTKSAIVTLGKQSSRHSRSLEELKEVKERAEKLQEIQESQDKEIEKHLDIVTSPEMLVGHQSPDVASADVDVSKKQSTTPKSPVSSVSEKQESIDYSTDSFSDDKENF